jgi:hypothetical protein
MAYDSLIHDAANLSSAPDDHGRLALITSTDVHEQLKERKTARAKALQIRPSSRIHMRFKWLGLWNLAEREGFSHRRAASYDESYTPAIIPCV